MRVCLRAGGHGSLPITGSSSFCCPEPAWRGGGRWPIASCLLLQPRQLAHQHAPVLALGHAGLRAPKNMAVSLPCASNASTAVTTPSAVGFPTIQVRAMSSSRRCRLRLGSSTLPLGALDLHRLYAQDDPAPYAAEWVARPLRRCSRTSLICGWSGLNRDLIHIQAWTKERVPEPPLGSETGTPAVRTTAGGSTAVLTRRSFSRENVLSRVCVLSADY